MTNFETILQRGKIAIEELRKQTLTKGDPFLVYDSSLPIGQFYLEYPDGDIKVVSVSSQQNDYIICTELTSPEVRQIRHKLSLPAIF